jgi:hypothetical protein
MVDRAPTLGDASPFDAVPTQTLLNAFPDPGIDGLEEFVPAVLHTVQPIDNMVIDWDGVRDSICQLFWSGCKWPVVSLSQNGALGVG